MPCAFQVEIAAKTDIGLRENNEDNYLVADLTTQRKGLSPEIQKYTVGPAGAIFVVSDGVGGQHGGEVASLIAVETIVDSMLHWAQTGLPFEDALKNSILLAHREVLDNSSTDPRLSRMAATVTAVGMIGDKLFVGNVGDSRAYLLRQGLLRQLTKDQTQAQVLADAGMIMPEEIRLHNGWHILSQALGSNDPIEAVITSAELQHGDLILLSSDGLTDALEDDRIEHILQQDLPLWDRCHLLVEQAKASEQCEDNISVVLVSVLEEARREETA